MKQVLKLELTPEQYQQLVECYFAGSIVLEELYPDQIKNMELGSLINAQASSFGKAELVFTAAQLNGLHTVSLGVEERVIPLLFGEND